MRKLSEVAKIWLDKLHNFINATAHAELSAAVDSLAAYEDLGPVEEFAALKERMRWIPVSERLPEKDGFYNVVMNGDIWGEPDVWSATSCGFYNGKWDEDGATITHWMPLPSAPDSEVANGN